MCGGRGISCVVREAWEQPLLLPVVSECYWEVNDVTSPGLFHSLSGFLICKAPA
jgi:hypothetical protein